MSDQPKARFTMPPGMPPSGEPRPHPGEALQQITLLVVVEAVRREPIDAPGPPRLARPWTAPYGSP